MLLAEGRGQFSEAVAEHKRSAEPVQHHTRRRGSEGQARVSEHGPNDPNYLAEKATQALMDQSSDTAASSASFGGGRRRSRRAGAISRSTPQIQSNRMLRT